MFINSTPQRSSSCTGQQAPPPPAKMRGLGDLVETVTKKTGIKAAVDFISKKTGKDCGCAKRRDKLNKIAPFRENENGN